MSEFSLEHKGSILIIHLPSRMDEALSKKFHSVMDSWISPAVKLFVVNFKGVTLINETFYKTITLFGAKVRKEAKSMGSINLSLSLLGQIRGAGMEPIFCLGTSVAELCAKYKLPQPPKPKIDAKFIQPFVAATKEIIEQESGTKTTPLNPFLKTAAHTMKIDIVGIIYVVSEKFRGSIQMSFPQPVILKFYEKSFEETLNEITIDVQYYVGDIASKVLKRAKGEIETSLGIKITDGFPSVILCDASYKREMSNQITLVLPFDTVFGKFLLEITTDELSYSQVKNETANVGAQQ